jgi:hypothetical protein
MKGVFLASIGVAHSCGRCTSELGLVNILHHKVFGSALDFGMARWFLGGSEHQKERRGSRTHMRPITAITEYSIWRYDFLQCPATFPIPAFTEYSSREILFREI